jgi:hypothetical protein
VPRVQVQTARAHRRPSRATHGRRRSARHPQRRACIERRSGDDPRRGCRQTLRAERSGAKIVNRPSDQPFGERQYTAEDFTGRQWVFTQTIADVAPEEWGGTTK